VISYVSSRSGRLVLRAAHASDLPQVAAWPLIPGVAVTGVALLLFVSAVFGPPRRSHSRFWAAAITALDLATANAGPSRAGFPGAPDLIGIRALLALSSRLVQGSCRGPAILARHRPISGVYRLFSACRG
jgi:hypothetical protein